MQQIKIVLFFTIFFLYATAGMSSPGLWKRQTVLQNDLIQALELDKTSLCSEIDRLRCFEDVHQISLGGYDPFSQGRFEGISSPALTTAISFERVVQIACANRMRFELKTTPKLFKPLLSGSSIDRQTVINQASILFRRFHGRDISGEERSGLASFPLSIKDNPESLGQMLCVAIGTMTEFLIY